jgi:hypothetical protein
LLGKVLKCVRTFNLGMVLTWPTLILWRSNLFQIVSFKLYLVLMLRRCWIVLDIWSWRDSNFHMLWAVQNSLHSQFVFLSGACHIDVAKALGMSWISPLEWTTLNVSILMYCTWGGRLVTHLWTWRSKVLGANHLHGCNIKG